MRSLSLRLPVLVVTILGGISSTVWGWGNRTVLETVFLEPTPMAFVAPTMYETTSWVMPTTYEPTAWITPTSYFLPTSATYSTVYPTSYVADSIMVAPTAYALETTYRRRGLFGRRWRVDRPVITAYATGYVPSAYFLPTTSRMVTYGPTVMRDPGVIQAAYASAANCPCPATGVSAGRATSKSATPTNDRKSVQSRPADEVTSSEVGPAPGEIDNSVSRGGMPEAAESGRKPAASRANETDAATETAGSGFADNSPPPPPPAATKPATKLGEPVSKRADSVPNSTTTGGGSQIRKAPAVPAGAAKSEIEMPPAAPGADQPEIMPAPEKPESIRRDSQRPVFAATPRIRPATTRNVLFGMVESSSAGEPEEGVRVTLASVSQTGRSRDTVTNAFGKFAISVPDGNYSVMVTMPSGRQHVVDGPLGRISVKNGLITDEGGRDIPSVIISR